MYRVREWKGEKEGHRESRRRDIEQSTQTYAQCFAGGTRRSPLQRKSSRCRPCTRATRACLACWPLDATCPAQWCDTQSPTISNVQINLSNKKIPILYKSRSSVLASNLKGTQKARRGAWYASRTSRGSKLSTVASLPTEPLEQPPRT